MSSPRSPRDRPPPIPADFLFKPESSRQSARKLRSFLLHWSARLGCACARGWSALGRAGRLFVVYAIGLVILTAVLPTVALWGLAIAGLLVFGWRARRWRDLDRKGRSFVVCGNLASVVALSLAIGGSSHKPGDGTRTVAQTPAETETPSDTAVEKPAPPARQPRRYTVTELGTLGGETTWPRAINNAGQVVGHSDTKSGEEHAFLWQASAGMRDLGTLGGAHSEAESINDKGQVVGWASTIPLWKGDYGIAHAFLWDRVREMQDLAPALRGLMGPECEATAINDDGQIAGRRGIMADEEDRGFLLEPDGKIHELGNLTPVAINSTGQVAGIIQGGHKLMRAGLWRPDRGLQPIETLDEELGRLVTALGPGQYRETSAWGINNKGHVVVVVSTQKTKGDARAFLWHSGAEMKEIRPPGVDGSAIYNAAINNAGQVVLSYMPPLPDGPDPGSPRCKAYVYDQGVTTHLNELIDPASGCCIIQACAINDHGQIVAFAAKGRDFNDRGETVVLPGKRLELNVPCCLHPFRKAFPPSCPLGRTGQIAK